MTDSAKKHAYYLRYKDTPYGRAARARASLRYRQKHRKQIKLKTREWREKNHAKSKATSRAWKKTHHQETMAWERAYRNTPAGQRKAFRLLNDSPEGLLQLAQLLYKLKQEMKNEHQ